MGNQKMDVQLNMALELSREEREQSLDLNVGFEDGMWEVILRYAGEETREYLSRRWECVFLFGGYAIVRINEAELVELTRISGVLFVEKPKRLQFALFQGKAASCIGEVQNTVKEEQSLSGKGILVGIVDSGVDFYHKDFQKEDGTTRIVRLWDQSALGNPPEGYRMGTEYTQKQLNEYLKLYRETGEKQRIAVDNSGHGTAVLGIAAGNGVESEGAYRGIAYESDLMVVKLAPAKQNFFPRTTQLMQGVDYLVRMAMEMEKPIVINLSFGNSYGSHRGDSLLESYLDMVSGIGRVTICVGTGNEGALALHTQGKIEEWESKVVEFAVGKYEAALNIQLWKSYVDEMEIVLESPSGERRRIMEEMQAVRYEMQDTQVLVYYGEPGPYHVTQEIYFDFLPLKQYVNNGSWKLIFTGKRICEGEYELWMPGGGTLNRTTGFYFSNVKGTLTIPSTARKVISVGAYDSGNDSLADFSGRGSERFQIEKPDLVAPGVEILAPAVNGGYKRVTGTSFSTPFVSGGTALLMQWGITDGKDPYLYGEKVKAYLRRGARKLEEFEQYPNEEVGWGALCVKQSLPAL